VETYLSKRIHKMSGNQMQTKQTSAR
jgi:hypothetical protein